VQGPLKGFNVNGEASLKKVKILVFADHVLEKSFRINFRWTLKILSNEQQQT